MEIWEFLAKRSILTGVGIAVGATLLTSVLLPVAARVGRPAAKAVLKGGLLAYEGGRNVVVGVTGAAATAGVTFPPAESVDIHGEVNGLREILMRLDSPDRRKVENALEDAQIELGKPEPNRDEVGKALHRALGYAREAGDFAGAATDIAPRIVSIAGWLGRNWRHLLPLVELLD